MLLPLFYATILLLHLCCAIAFTGFCFTLTFILPALKQLYNYKEAKYLGLKKGVVLIPCILFLLVCSGLLLAFLKKDLNFFLYIKFILSFFVVLGVCYWVGAKLVGFKPSLCFLKSFRLFSPLASLSIAALGLASIYFN